MTRRKAVFLVVLCFFLVSLGSVLLGSVSITLSDVWGSLTSPQPNFYYHLIWNFRLPKLITAILVGASLSISGLHMQTLFRNPLAGPSILGISSGAGLGAALFIFFQIHFLDFFSISGISRNWYLAISGGAGAMLILVFVYIISRKISDPASLLIVGMMLSMLSSSIIALLQFFSQAESVQAYVLWGMGSLGGMNWQEVKVLAFLVIPVLILTLTISKNLNGYMLGDKYAISLGVPIRKMQIVLLVFSGILVGATTAFCGPIGFVGLAVPHLCRILFKTTDHQFLGPISMLFGAVTLVFFDLIAQLPGLEATLPINAVTSFFGAPFVILLLLRRKTISFS